MLSRPEILLEVAGIRRLAPRVSAYRLVSSDGGDLPAWDAGAHLNLRLPSGRARCYSLCGDPALRSEYLIAVQREDDGEGGSLEVAQAFARGFTVRTDPPRNGFPLGEDAKRHVLMAAGIGITPIIAMIHEVRRAGADFFTHVFSRSVEETAFHEIIAEEIAAGRAALHHGASNPLRGPSLPDLVGAAAEGTHVYACGPLKFLAAFRAATAAWPRDNVHIESFVPELTDKAGDTGFEIELACNGKLLQVPAGETIHAVLAANGHAVDSSCRQGICGSCMVRYLDGEPDHRDEALSDDERQEFLTVCCSRARSARLVLDV